MGYLGSLWRILDGEEGNQNIVNTAIQQHCFSMTCRILVLSDGTNSIRAFFLSTQHEPNYFSQRNKCLSQMISTVYALERKCCLLSWRSK